MTQKQKGLTIVGVVLVPLLLLFAFNALIVQPQIAEVQAEKRGLTFPTEIQDLRVTGDALMLRDLTVVGTLSSAALVSDGNASLITLNTSGNITDSGDLAVAGAATIGGGYGDTGCTLSTAGVLQCNGAATTDGALTAASAVLGGGFGSTGCTISAAGVLQCDGAATLGGAATVTGVATFVGHNIYSTASITPTDGGTLTPTAEIVTLTPAGAVGTALGACTTGQSTVLYNSVNAAVVITDTGNGLLAGNQTLGQYDALFLACIASKWVQVSAASAN